MVFAHQGGWDEILFAIIPIIVVAGLLLLANHRANGIQSRASEAATPGPVDEPPAE